MFSRRTLPIWIGVILLSGMFLMGQDTWGPVHSQRLLPDTGITKCYNMSEEIECPAPGQPFYGQDAQYTSNPMSYTDHGDGTVTDNVTGLIWQKCSAGLSGEECAEGGTHFMNWFQTISYCQGLNLAGYTNWRVPDIYELVSIINMGRINPAINTAVFPGTEYSTAPPPFSFITSQYASSSSFVMENAFAWTAWFGFGVVSPGQGLFPKTATAFAIRCVRGGKTPPQNFTDHGNGTVTDNVTGLMWQQQDDGIERDWEQSVAYCQNLGLGGHADWRLPDGRKLVSIVDYSQEDPVINTVVFPGTSSSSYWSSSTRAGRTDYAWDVHFGYGFVGASGKPNTYYVRCVR